MTTGIGGASSANRTNHVSQPSQPSQAPNASSSSMHGARQTGSDHVPHLPTGAVFDAIGQVFGRAGIQPSDRFRHDRQTGGQELMQQPVSMHSMLQGARRENDIASQLPANAPENMISPQLRSIGAGLIGLGLATADQMMRTSLEENGGHR